jgi:CRP/FNR family transcriptional regulator
MNTHELIEKRFGKEFSNKLIEFLSSESLVFPVIKGQKIIKRGLPFNYIVLVLDGTLKVIRTDEKGNEHVLFYLKDGESCSATFALCNERPSEIDLEAEQDGVILLIPNKLMDRLMDEYPDWRKYVLNKFGDRLSEFLDTLDSITFQNLDERLLKYLQDKSKVLGSKEIRITHQDIAKDLATSRVVISRLLKMFERKGLVKLYRNKIRLLEI